MAFWLLASSCIFLHLLAIQPSTSQSPVEAAYSLRQTACTSCKFIEFISHPCLSEVFRHRLWDVRMGKEAMASVFTCSIPRRITRYCTNAPVHAARFAPTEVQPGFLHGLWAKICRLQHSHFRQWWKAIPTCWVGNVLYTEFWEVIPDEQFTARKGEACECLRQVHCSGKQQRETQRCESLWLDDRHFPYGVRLRQPCSNIS